MRGVQRELAARAVSEQHDARAVEARGLGATARGLERGEHVQRGAGPCSAFVVAAPVLDLDRGKAARHQKGREGLDRRGVHRILVLPEAAVHDHRDGAR